MVTAVTPTGDRSDAFRLCRLWISRQTIRPDQWIVVDDGKIPLPEDLRSGVEYIRRKPDSGEGHTLTKNLRIAVPLIKGDKILIIEDDDYYGPNYIDKMQSLLLDHSLVGESFARYYHVPTMKYRRVNNPTHASLCQTGFRKELLSKFVSCLEGDPYVDMRLWHGTLDSAKYLIKDTEDNLKLHCSTKGLKGRKGIGVGHKSESKYYQMDSELLMLEKWVGVDNAKLYMEHVGQSYGSAKLLGVDKRNVFTTGSVSVQTAPFITPQEVPPEEGITVITCTGDRPQAFDLLRKWMGTQTKKPNQWIVVDDGKTPMKNRREYKYYRREPTEKDFVHTLCLNLPIALKAVRNEKVIIMEDDDWYSPVYVEYMSKLLDSTDLVGFKNLLFYHLPLQSYMKKPSTKQPAFAQTAFRKIIIPILQNICQQADRELDLCNKGLIDKILWKDPLSITKYIDRVKLTTSLKTASGAILSAGTVFDPPIPLGIRKKALRNQGAAFVKETYLDTARKSTVVCDNYITVGIKGMPGRRGLTTAHDDKNIKYIKDTDYKLLKSIIKKDINFYLELFS